MEYIYNESMLSSMSPDEQKKEMKKWFYSKFEDPVNSCPYIDGEYEYIYGGPYDAHEELSSKFSNFIPDELIDKLAEELNYQSYYWSAIETPDWHDEEYDIDYIDNMIISSDAYNQFRESIDKINLLSEVTCSDELKKSLYKMLYANIITALETYLSETFIKKIFESKEALNKFLCNNKEFKDKKFTLSQIYQNKNIVDNTVKEYLATTLWHNIDKISKFYLFTFGVKFPQVNYENILYAVQKRHDIVHRNGKSPDGKEVEVLKPDVLGLSELVVGIVDYIQEQFYPLPF